MRLLIVCLLLLGVLNQYAAGFYLPGVKMQEYAPTDIVDIKVNKLTSKHTQLPYKYYTLAFCKPKTETFKVENLGEILRGDKIENSLYEVSYSTLYKLCVCIAYLCYLRLLLILQYP